MSCQQRANPIPELGASHWIKYDFQEEQSIEAMRIWNITHPVQSKSGAKRLRVDVSSDGMAWNLIGVYDIEQGSTSKEYVGELLPDMLEFQARHVVLTILETHGSPACGGLAEVQFLLGEGTVATNDTYLASLITIIPNPVDRNFTVFMDGISTSEIAYQMIDMSGRLLFQDRLTTYGTKNEIELSGAALPDGQYTLRIDTDKGSVSKKVLVVHPR